MTQHESGRREHRESDEAADAPDEPLVAAYRATVGPLYRYVSRRCGGNRELAEDVTQEAYLRAVRAWAGGRTPDEPLAWLRTVARNLLVTHYRRSPPVTVDPRTVDRILEDREPDTPAAARVIHWGLQRVETSAARLLEAFHLDGKPIGRIARETGLTERAVEGRLRRARERLRRRLEPIVRATGDDHAP